MSATPAARPGGTPRRRVCVVGSGPRFLSGISYYTNRLANELGARHDVSVILMRQLLPTRLYPGRARVGHALVRFTYPPGAAVTDGVDWWWGRSMLRAIRQLVHERPDVVVLQWWTGTVLHSYLALVLAARLLGAKVLIEFHEVQDTGELGVPLASAYVRSVIPLLIASADGYIVHTAFDRALLESTYGLRQRPVALIPHGPYDQYRGDRTDDGGPVLAEPTDDVCRLLSFGIIRPYKGVEDLIAAIDGLSDEEAARFHLTVVGETWEGWTRPGEMIAASPHADRITFVNRYVADDEIAAIFGAADAVVLPYLRSSASGPLHLAMAAGLPVVVTTVGGLVEAAEGYAGAIPTPPGDPGALRAALHEAWRRRGERYEDVHSWDRTVERYGDTFDLVLDR